MPQDPSFRGPEGSQVPPASSGLPDAGPRPREGARAPAIAVEHLRRVYGEFTAVDDLSFEVSAGEIVGLIGPNGAGKTTTLRALAGILKPTSGHVRIDGFDLSESPIEAKRRLAFMPDEPHLFEYLTVQEPLRLVAT